MPKIDKKLFKEITPQTTYFFNEIFLDLLSDTSYENIKKMLKDDAISSSWTARRNAVQGRELRIDTSSNDPKHEEIRQGIEYRFNAMNLANNLGEIMDTELYKRGYWELMYNENFDIDKPYKELRKQSLLSFKEDTNKGITTFNNGKLLPENKIIKTYYQKDKENPLGISILEPLVDVYNRRNLTQASIDEFIKKFGKIITWVGYDPDEPREKVEEQIKGITEAEGKTTIGVPMYGDEKVGLGTSFGFITLENMKTDTQLSMLRHTLESIELVIKGASFSKAGDSGSFAKDDVSNQIREDIIEGDIKYIRDVLQQLIEIDSKLYNYDPNLFFFKFIKGEDKDQEANLKQKLNKNLQLAASAIQTLSNAGIGVTLDGVSHITGIPLKNLKEIEGFFAKTNSLPIAKGEEAPKKVSKQDPDIHNLDEFESSGLVKKKELSNALRDEFHNNVDKIEEAVIKSLKKSLNKGKIVKEDDISIEIDLNERFEEVLILSTLYGMSNFLDEHISILEYEDVTDEKEFNPFELEYTEAIDFFMKKVAIGYDQLEEITERVQNNKFWMKKITELELTNSVKKSLDKAIKEGKSFNTWRKDLNLNKISDGYAKVVYRNATGQAYMTGRYEQQMNSKNLFPYWLYDSVMDKATTEICTLLNDKVFRADNPIWNRIYPPSHDNCRSDVIALSDNDLRVLKIKSNEVDKYIDKVKSDDIYKDWLKKDRFTTNPAKLNYEDLYNQKVKALEVK